MLSPSDPIDLAAIKKLSPVAENFRIFYYAVLGDPPNTVLHVKGCVLRPATRGPRKGELCVPVPGTERECFLSREDTDPAPKALEAFAILHIPTGEYMPSRMFRGSSGGWSHWIPGPEPDGWCGCRGFDKNPRIFFSLRSAQNALTAWLMGIHRRESGVTHDWEGIPDGFDDHIVDAAPVPRVRGDMEIIPLQLVGLK